MNTLFHNAIKQIYPLTARLSYDPLHDALIYVGNPSWGLFLAQAVHRNSKHQGALPIMNQWTRQPLHSRVIPRKALAIRKFALCGAIILLTSACSSSSDGTGSTTTGSVPGELAALPNPPLTQAPSQDDEPIVEAANFSTITEFQVVRDPGPRIPVSVEVTLTQADFDAGPLPSIINTPDNVDPATNAAPFFDNLTDIETVAGTQLEIIYKPVDPDGDIPGMFPEELPPGASFDDNFDGTKTYRWQPLQNDVGINEFTVTAIDARNNQYRTVRTIRIKVDLPDDPTTIPNVAPMLDEYLPHTVRQNDVVVLELKGIDLNGTIPSLELVSNLPGASFVQHPRYEEIYTLQFIAATVGQLDIDILARDSIDASLTNTDTISLNVLPATAFAPSGSRLKDLASARNIQFGYASLPEFYHRPDGGIYAATAASEFNLVSPENSMKMDVVNPLPGRYQFADIDNLLSFAKLHNMDVHGHPVLWYRQLPDWIQEVAPATVEGHMREYIDRLMGRYKNDISLWDVVNEPIGENGGFRSSVWYDAIGESYLDIAFRQARLTAPNARLLLNDFDIAFNGPKADTLFTMLDGMIERQVPIDGVGFQLHLFSSFNQFNDVRANFQKVADRDLDIYITEFDVALSPGASLQDQANVYRQIVDLCLEQPRCKAIQTWGFTDQYSFRKIFTPLLFDDSYMEKPAYSAVQDALSPQ